MGLPPQGTVPLASVTLLACATSGVGGPPGIWSTRHLQHAMLRGRGGCYKHTFYGIESHRCMEVTPSLACANKCVFCWRHHTNPVGTEWRWKMDPAEQILDEALDNHHHMIRQFRGVPGVKPERYQEGLDAKHCALSLVGEPIMYPEINAFLRLLHVKRISSFLVMKTRARGAVIGSESSPPLFAGPTQTMTAWIIQPSIILCQSLRAGGSLVPVTQLYVSVDASTEASLKKIDRPLFRDFWTRFLDSLKALGEKVGPALIPASPHPHRLDAAPTPPRRHAPHRLDTTPLDAVWGVAFEAVWGGVEAVWGVASRRCGAWRRGGVGRGVEAVWGVASRRCGAWRRGGVGRGVEAVWGVALRRCGAVWGVGVEAVWGVASRRCGAWRRGGVGRVSRRCGAGGVEAVWGVARRCGAWCRGGVGVVSR
ncbi:hypothetical protein CRUP_006643, partial [Coryphaenoides rupestris]